MRNNSPVLPRILTAEGPESPRRAETGANTPMMLNQEMSPKMSGRRSGQRSALSKHDVQNLNRSSMPASARKGAGIANDYATQQSQQL